MNDAQDTPLISLRNVSLSYWLKGGLLKRRRHYALSNVSFDLYRGDSLGVIGRNGCGKSTLLRLLAGVMGPDKGEITGAEKVTSSLLSLQLGFVDYLSGRENAILSGMFLGMGRREIEARLEAIVEFSELGEFINQPLSTYSSGMRARLGFAVAFQMDPDVLLIDEVLGVGDAEFRQKSFQMLKERIHSASSTVVFVSHSANEVRSLCNRAVWLEEGRVMMAGEASDTVDAYEDALAQRHQEQLVAIRDNELPIFVREKGGETIYVLREGKLKPINSWQEFVDLGGRTELVKVITKETMERLVADPSDGIEPQ